IDGSTFPNWDGDEQKRVVTVSGDELKIINPSAAVGGTAYSVWKRAK
ncbi:MAG: lipocalin-like domain-containing protein, partial [Rhodocyclaceae bacterium]|nr:lipocalin-like domain-containing protein [Rhodocyclaceae bacterium]